MGMVRAYVMKYIVDHLQGGDAPEFQTILADFGSEAVARVESSNRLEWMPMDFHFDIIRPIRKHLPRDAGVELFHQIWLPLLEGPAFGTLMRGIRALGRPTPATFVKQAPRGFPFSFKDFGKIEFHERSDTSCHIDYLNVPREAFAPDVGWHVCAGGSLRCCLDLSGYEGTVEVTDVDPDAGNFRILVEWDDRRKGA